MIRKVIALLVCTLMVFTFITGCGNQSTDKTSTQESSSIDTQQASTEKVENTEPVTISVGGWPSEASADMRKTYQAYADTVTSKYPNITITPDEWLYTPDTFLPKAASGTLPTLYQVYFTETGKIANGGYTADLTTAMKSYGYMDSVNENVLKLCQNDGKYYYVPSNGYTIGLMQNVALFKEAGLVDAKGIPLHPKTYDEMALFAKQIKEKTGKAGFLFPSKDGHGGWAFMNVLWSFGGEFEKQVDGKWQAAYNSPEAVAALQFVKDLKWKYNCLTDNVMYNIIEAMEPFGTGKVAMTFCNLDLINFPVDQFKMSKDNIAMSPLPAGPAGAYTLMGGAVWSIAPNSTPTQIDAAFKFIEAYGNSPKADDQSLKGLEDGLKVQQTANQIVGPYMPLIFAKGERSTKEALLYDKYKTVNMDFWKDYLLSPTTLKIKTEEPYNTQELYAALDIVLQTVFTDKNADPKATLDKSVAAFQSTYLDKVK